MSSLHKLFLRLFILLLLSSGAAAESENPVLEAAAKLLPQLPAHCRLELVEVWAKRGELEMVKELQKGWEYPNSPEARLGQGWLALLDPETPFPTLEEPSRLLSHSPSVASADRLLSKFRFSQSELLEAAQNCKERKLAQHLLRQAEEEVSSASSAEKVARVYLKLDDRHSVERLVDKFSISTPVLLAWLERDYEDPESHFPSFLSEAQERLATWRKDSAELAVFMVSRGDVSKAERLIHHAWLAEEEVTQAARGLAHRDMRLALAQHFGDTEEEGMIKLPEVTDEERESLCERVTNVPDDGDGYPDLSVPARLFQGLGTEMSRATFERLYEATDFTILGFPGIGARRHYDYEFLLLHQAHDPTYQLEKVVHWTKEPSERFQLLIRLGAYYPSDSWPVLPRDQELLEAL